KTVGESHSANFSESRIGFFRSCCVNTGADASFLRASFKGGSACFPFFGSTAHANQLINSRHSYSFLSKQLQIPCGCKVGKIDDLAWSVKRDFTGISACRALVLHSAMLVLGCTL